MLYRPPTYRQHALALLGPIRFSFEFRMYYRTFVQSLSSCLSAYFTGLHTVQDWLLYTACRSLMVLAQERYFLYSEHCGVSYDHLLIIFDIYMKASVAYFTANRQWTLPARSISMQTFRTRCWGLKVWLEKPLWFRARFQPAKTI